MEGRIVGPEGNDRMSGLTRESVAAIFSMTCAADLERRMGITRERANVPDDRLIPFYAVLPDGLDNGEQRSWINMVSEGLAAVVKDAQLNIMVNRTLQTMKDLGLGEDGDGGTRND